MPTMSIEPGTRTSHWIATAGLGLMAATAPQGAALAQSTRIQTRHITALPSAQAPRPSIDPVDVLARANTLGFTSAQSVSGVVRELATHRPLAGVWVIAAWEGESPTGRVCFDADTVRTDAAGHFALNTWRHTLLNLGIIADQRLRLFVYRSGYEFVRLERRQILLRTVQDSPEERLAALRDIEFSALYCPQYAAHDRTHDAHFQPLVAEMAAEVQALPDDMPGQRTFLGELRRQLAPTRPAAR